MLSYVAFKTTQNYISDQNRQRQNVDLLAKHKTTQNYKNIKLHELHRLSETMLNYKSDHIGRQNDVEVTSQNIQNNEKLQK